MIWTVIHTMRWVVLGVLLWAPSVLAADTTPPTVPGQPVEGATGGSPTFDKDYNAEGIYYVSWTGSSDPESAMFPTYELQEKIGVTGAWVTLASALRTVETKLQGRLHNTRYFYRVRAKNSDGLWSAWSAGSDGLLVDTTPSSPVTVTDDGNYTNSTSILHATWTTSSDPESGVSDYLYLIRQDSTSGPVIVPTTSTGLSTQVTRTGLTLNHGASYYIGVVARNGARAFSATRYSNGITVDTVAPTTTITAPVNAATVSGLIDITATVAEENSMGSMQFKVDGVNVGAADATSPYSVSWDTKTTANGSHVISAIATDAAGNTAMAATVSVTVNNGSPDTTPPTGSLSINSGAALTKTTAVTLTLSATDTGGSVAQIQFSNDGSAYSMAETYATSKAWTLASGDGTKTVYAKFKDAAGNLSAAVSDTITLDTTAPTISAVAVGSIAVSGATITWTTNEASTTQVDYGTTTSYGQSTALNSSLVTSHSTPLSGLSAGTLYHYRVRSKDAAGNERIDTDATFTTTQAADTVAPAGTITVNTGAAATNNRTVTLTLAATDNSGSVAQMRFSDNGSTYSTAEAYATTKSWTLPTGDGSKTVYAQFKDAAGNWSAAASDAIVLDTVAPSLSFTSPLDGAVITAP